MRKHNTKFYKKKEDFTADYWINFEGWEDGKVPRVEIDIQEKDF